MDPGSDPDPQHCRKAPKKLTDPTVPDPEHRRHEYSRYLKPTFDQIERGDGGVGDAARQHAAQGAEGVELG